MYGAFPSRDHVMTSRWFDVTGEEVGLFCWLVPVVDCVVDVGVVDL